MFEILNFLRPKIICFVSGILLKSQKSVKIRLEKRFNNVLHTKQAFFGHKKSIFQSSKNRIFPKGLTHAFGKKIRSFYSFVFSQNKRGKKV